MEQPLSPATSSVMAELANNVVYLMGMSFILGSLFTILLLVLLDFMRVQTAKNPNDSRRS